MKPIFNVGPFTIYFFGIMIAIGALIGLLLFIREVKRRGFNEKILIDGIFYSLIGGIVGARLIYVLVYNPSFYFTNPMEILSIHKGGLSIHGGILGGLIVGYIFLKRHKLPLFQILDIAAPSLILAQGISRIGCDVFGGPISHSLPWGIEFKGEYLHPAQAYEFILNYLLFGYLWLRLKRPNYYGQVFTHYLIGFLVIRGIVEFSRINPMVMGLLSVSHVMSILGILFGLILSIYLRQNQIKGQSSLFDKNDLVKTSVSVLILITVSLQVYYSVQG
ncbi:prolipoprotein diacylglyceryl transferase [Evansella cellulosilytica]|uniref:Phosphatidylglycerol--prolipoprotein diacylglyceryl transferase n=1 Tax=Evansella cellulosilytica (strain ATCC 21833 / DSM 2522 / FERM P-1141 / JCM 9156 / N-4) TaxID=649639 RepID=E6TYX7_EVAC2|nr:prolipoprotein diacylglyceryl transferase [Evansella cellulosilytica]ADU31312.1 prolipoprotein diacylglyceryl transferase [Evansella cellulosilytica DSM 2522]